MARGSRSAAFSRTASRNSSPTRTSDDADVALVDRRDAQHVVLRVEQHDPQLLALEAAHLQDQAVGDVVRAADRSSDRTASRPAAGGRARRRRPAARPSRGRSPAERGQLQLGRPRPARSGRRDRASASAARSTAERPREPAPHTSPISSAEVSPAGPRWASRSRGRSVTGSSRIGPPRPPGHDRFRPRRPPGGVRGGSGVPEARTTGARRFPPPSGPRGRLRSLPMDPHRRLNDRCTAASPG